MAELSNNEKISTDTKKKSLVETEVNEENEEAIEPLPENENLITTDVANKEADGTLSDANSVATTVVPGKKKNCCYRFWNAIFKFFSNDAIYGSFVGPHPVSFLCCCVPCKSVCKGTCKRPFLLGSIATKTMWFLMLIVTIILSCFFIIPYPENNSIESIYNFFPCKDPGKKEGRWVNDQLEKDCSAHGGYFMVYRNFFAFNFLLLISCLIMINVKSTGKNRKRAKMHHGFWMYKYMILFVLLLIAYLGIRVEAGGVFEYIMSWIGLLSSLIFSFVEITFLLDIIEPIAKSNRLSSSDWADCLYWTFSTLILMLDIGIIVLLCCFFATYQHYDSDPNSNTDRAVNEGKVSPLHLGIIIYAIFMSLVLIVMAVINKRKNRFPNTGVLQTSLIIAYLLGVIWTALGNSPDIYARPHYNVYKNIGGNETILQKGSLDTYFKAEGCAQGLAAFLALIYYVFWHGPRSTTAPLSILFNKIMYSQAKKPEVPVLPNSEENDEFAEALVNLKVFDDEKRGVRYSWTMFYVFLMLGSSSIMMGMSNFSDPFALKWYASSYPALAIKITISLMLCIAFILCTTFPCQKIFPDKEDIESAPENESVAVNPSNEDTKQDVPVEEIVSPNEPQTNEPVPA